MPLLLYIILCSLLIIALMLLLAHKVNDEEAFAIAITLSGTAFIVALFIYSGDDDDDETPEPYRIENVVHIMPKEPGQFEAVVQEGDNYKYIDLPGYDTLVLDLPLGETPYVECKPSKDDPKKYDSFIHVHSLNDIKGFETRTVEYRP